MKSLISACLLSLLVLAPAGHAQHAASSPADLKTQMSAAEFDAAGLAKLDTTELEALNAWLNRKAGAETAAAVAAAVAVAKEEGRQEVVQQNRGFFDFGTSEPIVAHLVGEFAGFGKGREYTLDNGQVWEQTDESTLPGVRKSHPQISIKPGALGVWFMRVQGYNTTAKVRRIK